MVAQVREAQSRIALVPFVRQHIAVCVGGTYVGSLTCEEESTLPWQLTDDNGNAVYAEGGMLAAFENEQDAANHLVAYHLSRYGTAAD